MPQVGQLGVWGFPEDEIEGIDPGPQGLSGRALELYRMAQEGVADQPGYAYSLNAPVALNTRTGDYELAMPAPTRAMVQGALAVPDELYGLYDEYVRGQKGEGIDPVRVFEGVAAMPAANLFAKAPEGAVGSTNLFRRGGSTGTRTAGPRYGRPPIEAQDVRFEGRSPSEWTPEEWHQFGRQHGVENLGPETPGVAVKTKDGGTVSIPGGFEGTFTYYDLLKLKSMGINPETAFDDATHAQLQKKMVRTMTPKDLPPEEVFSRMAFGMTSPNNPLLPNQVAATQIRPRSVKDIERLAAYADWEPGASIDPGRREAVDEAIRRDYGLQKGEEGGTGAGGSQDYSNVAEAAKLFLKKPEWFRLKPEEDWPSFVERFMNQVRGTGAKVGSFSLVWQNPEGAEISAIDRHMIKKFHEDIHATPEEQKAWEAKVAQRWNDRVDKRRDADAQLKDELIDAKEHAKLVKNLPGGKATPVGDFSQLVERSKLPAHQSAGEGSFVVDQMLSEVQKGSDYKVRTKKGALNPTIAQSNSMSAQLDNLLYEPEKFSPIGENYLRVLEANRASGQPHGLNLFGEQWRIWDRIRERLEPHETQFPELYKLPRMSIDQLRAAQKANTKAGYYSNIGAVKPTENPSSLALFALPPYAAPVGLGLGRSGVPEEEPY